ncbi:MAG: hypothetical protein M3Q39_10000 [Actinomycetota bacterium]|nr:hypothetical protein [Actinomycetota bacterium]
MPTYEALASKQNELIRKTLDGSVFLAPVTAPAIEAITDASSELVAPPAAYNDLGLLTNDGAQFGRDVSSSDMTSWGSVGPTRSDITADTVTLTVSCQETNITTLGLATSAELANAVPAPGGEVKIFKPSRPVPRFYRVLVLGVDEGDAGPIYIARFFPRVKVSSFAEQSFSGGDDGLLWGATMTAYNDKAFGTAEAMFFGGPGWLALLPAMGFQPAAAPAPAA